MLNHYYFTVDGLKKDKDYEFRVRAKNIAGLGEPSKPTDVIRTKPKYSKLTTILRCRGTVDYSKSDTQNVSKKIRNIPLPDIFN